MKKQITLEDWSYIGKRNYAARWLRNACEYSVEEASGGNYIRRQRINFWAYCLLFIPVHILQLFICAWDCGIKNFTVQGRELGHDILYFGSESWKRASELYKKCS